MDIPDFKNITYKSALAGSTGANLYKNTTNKKWVIKKSKKGEGGFAQVKSEATVNDIYEALGIRVPKHKLDIENKALILEYIDGKILGHTSKAEYDKAAAELRKGFVVDALLANWDVIGSYRDNIILPKDGSTPVRIDNGGALNFKATGGKKPFTGIVDELNTMRDKHISRTAYEVFGSITSDEIDNQIQTIIAPNYNKILSLTPDELKEIMKQRLDYLTGGNELNYNNSKNDIINEMILLKYGNNNIKSFEFDKIEDISKIIDEPFYMPSLTNIDRMIIKNYTANGYKYINDFLYSNKNTQLPTDIIYKWLQKRFPQEGLESDNHYIQRIFYHYFVNLYNSIQKAPKIGDNPFKVYRGTKTWYLAEDPTHFYYWNSFVSTTPIFNTARVFGKTPSFTAGGSNSHKIYTFYIHPLCFYRNVTPLSSIQSEKEVLFSPYHRYLYVDEENSENVTYKKYLIFPTDLDIPVTFETFILWKDMITSMSSATINNAYIAKAKSTINPFNALKSIVENTSNIPEYSTNLTSLLNTPLPKANTKKGKLKGISNKFKVLENILNEPNELEESNKLEGGVGRVLFKRSKPIRSVRRIKPAFIAPNIYTTLKFKPKKPNITVKNKSKNKVKEVKENKESDFMNRIVDPFPSFLGKKPTPIELSIIEKMKLLI